MRAGPGGKGAGGAGRGRGGKGGPANLGPGSSRHRLNPGPSLGGVPLASMRQRMESALAARRSSIAGPGHGPQSPTNGADVNDDEWDA